MDYSKIRKIVIKFFESDGSDLMEKYGRKACEKTAQAIVDLYEKYERDGHEGAGGEPFRPWIVDQAKEYIQSNFKPIQTRHTRELLATIGQIDYRVGQKSGKTKRDKGSEHGGLDAWFSGHGQGKSKTKGKAPYGDWIAITPVKNTITKEDGSKKTYQPGDIVGPCGISKKPEWKDITNNGKDPLKCMPRQKAHDLEKSERAELAKNKKKQENKKPDNGKPVNTPTFGEKANKIKKKAQTDIESLDAERVVFNKKKDSASGWKYIKHDQMDHGWVALFQRRSSYRPYIVRFEASEYVPSENQFRAQFKGTCEDYKDLESAEKSYAHWKSKIGALPKQSKRANPLPSSD